MRHVEVYVYKYIGMHHVPTTSIWWSDLHGVGGYVHVAVSTPVPARVPEWNPLLVAGKLDEFPHLLL